MSEILDLEASIKVAIDLMTTILSERIKTGETFESMELAEDIVIALYKQGLSHTVLIHHVNTLIIKIVAEGNN